MQITIRSLVLVVAALAPCLGASSSHAGTYGDEKWCAVTNNGGDALNWDCEYETVADCQPAVVQGSRGFCAINPYYQPPAPQPAPPQR